MTSSAVGDMRVSQASLSILEGSGWYQVDYNMSEPMTFGKGEGCNFINTTCMTSSTQPAFQEFCSPLTAIQCTWSGQSGGFCGTNTYQTDSSLPASWNYFGNDQTVMDAFADNCPLVAKFSNGNCEDPANQAQSALGSDEDYVIGSRCFTGTLHPDGSLATPYFFCFKPQVRTLFRKGNSLCGI